MATVKNKPQLTPFSKEDALITKAAIKNVESSMAFLRALSKEDARAVTKLNANREGFIRDGTLEIANANGSIPTLADLDKALYYYSCYESSYEIEDIMVELTEKIKRNRLWYGSQAFEQISRFYKSLDIAIKDEIEGAIEIKKRLGKYFENQGPNNSNRPDTTTAPEKKEALLVV